MEPIEINAGTYYLRPLRADDRIDDRPVILEAFTDPETRRWVADYRIESLADADAYVRQRGMEWAEDLRYSWAVADPPTGTMLGEVDLRGLNLREATADAACWTHPLARGRGVAATALRAVVRFGFNGLGLRRISYQHAEGNHSSRRVAEKCGFRFVDRREALQAGRQVELLNWEITPESPDDVTRS